MKTDEKLDRLLSFARGASPDISKTEAGFETRLMARIRGERAPLNWYIWSWRMVPVFSVVVIALGALYYVSPQTPQADIQAAITAEYDYSMAQNFLNGE